MGSPIADDDNLLLITLIVTVVFQLAFFFVAFACKFDKVSFSHCAQAFVVCTRALWLSFSLSCRSQGYVI